MSQSCPINSRACRSTRETVIFPRNRRKIFPAFVFRVFQFHPRRVDRRRGPTVLLIKEMRRALREFRVTSSIKGNKPRETYFFELGNEDEPLGRDKATKKAAALRCSLRLD